MHILNPERFVVLLCELLMFYFVRLGAIVNKTLVLENVGFNKSTFNKYPIETNIVVVTLKYDMQANTDVSTSSVLLQPTALSHSLHLKLRRQQSFFRSAC